MTSQKIAIVTGSSSGIGLETARLLAQNGFTVYATMRNIAKAKDLIEGYKGDKTAIKPVELDVTSDSSVKSAISKVASEAGRIDVLVNNAGYGLGGAFEDTSIEEARAQFDTNFFGVIRVTQAVLPVMRKQRSGIIVNVSSGAGRLGYPGASVYIATKHAIEGLTESIAYELEPFGIRVALVEPGVVSTNFGHSMVIAKNAQKPDSPYAPIMQKMTGAWEYMMKNGSTADLVARKILEAITASQPELRYPVGKDMEGWMQARNSMKDREFFAMMKQNLLQ